jgi:glycerol-3-phosphate O-acyltransferase
MTESSKVYPHVYPEISDWPIYKLLSSRKSLVSEIQKYTFERIKVLHSNDLYEVIAKTIYLERIRVKEEPWKVDEPDEGAFWKKLGRKLAKSSINGVNEGSQEVIDDILRTILHRYSEEIVGTFKISTFLFARQFLSVFFNRLLNTAAGRNMKRIFGSSY